MISIHGWRSDQYGLLQTPVRRVARRMGSRGCGVARSVLSQSVPSVGEAEVSPCLPAGRHRVSPKSALVGPPVICLPLKGCRRRDSAVVFSDGG